MREEIAYLLDFLFPRGSQDASIHGYLPKCNPRQIEPARKFFNFGFDSLEVLVSRSYGDSLIQDLIHRAKFQGELAIVDDLAELLVGVIKSTKEPLSNAGITFVPPDPKRLKQRGYHVPQLLALKVAKNTGLAYLEVFTKTKHTQSQVELSKEDRQRVLKGVFICREGAVQPVDKLWIVDDVLTTGATMEEALRSFRMVYSDISVSGLTVAG